uniref:Trans-1,2-dihydrobenzene-1,2-diol dehydrogenase n=1 Tax=Globodera pallida TaxID=36090 RepID=A0A183C4L1_GLOPA
MITDSVRKSNYTSKTGTRDEEKPLEQNALISIYTKKHNTTLAEMPSSAQRSRSELHWGVIGLGNIANDFILAMAYCRHPNKVVAVATSDSVERAHKFKQSVGLNSEEIKAYGNYEDLLRDPDVDIVYIATINSTHLPIIISALEHGKSVLCEKPMVLSSAEVSTVQMVQKTINQKEGRKLFGFWSCLFPSWQKIREVVRNGQMGDPKVVLVDFSQELVPEKRRDLSNGVCPLMDIGCYSVTFATFLFEGKKVVDVKAVGEKDEKGGGHAICYYNGLVSTNSTASVTLEMGNLELPERFWASTELRSREELQPNRKIEWKSEQFPFPESKGLFGLENPGDFVFHNSCGLNYEADHVWECIERDCVHS